MCEQHSHVLSEKVRTIIRTPRYVYIALASNSILWQLLPNLADSVLVSLAIAAMTISESELRIVGFVFEWALLLYLVYRLLPDLFPSGERLVEMSKCREFKLVVTLLVASIAIPINIYITTIPTWLGAGIFEWGMLLEDPYDKMILLSSILVSNWIISSLYLYARWIRHFSPEDHIVFFNQITPHELSDQARKEALRVQTFGGWITRFQTGVTVVASGGIIMIICLAFGIAVGVVGMLFPLPEVIILLAISGGIFAERLPEPVRDQLANVRQQTFDLDRRFYRVIRYVFASRKGLMVVPVIIMGYGVVATLVFIAIVAFAYAGLWILVLGFHALTGEVPPPSGNYTWWNLVGGHLCLALPGPYALWFWFRETFRLPHYLIYWEQSHQGDAKITATEDFPQLVTRPPGYCLSIIPPLILGGIFIERAATETPLTPLESQLYALAWPLVIIGIMWTVHWTMRNEPQFPRTDGRVILAAFLVQFTITLWLFSKSPTSPDTAPASGFEFGLLFIMTVIIITPVYYFPEISVYLEYDIDIKHHAVTLGVVYVTWFWSLGVIVIAIAPYVNILRIVIGWGLFIGGLLILSFITISWIVMRKVGIR